MKHPIYSRLVLGSIISAGAAYCAEPVYQWSFEEGEGTTAADSKCKVKVPLINFPENTRWVNGKRGTGVQIKRAEGKKKAGGLAMPLSPELFMKPFTLEFWVRFDDGIPRGTFRDMVGNGGDKGPGFRLTYWLQGLKVVSGDGKKVVTVGSGKLNILPDVWNMVAMTYDGGKIELFLNGEKVCSEKIQLTRGNKKLSLGSFGYGFAYPVEGTIDEFCYYDYAKTGEEIIQAYQKNML